MFIKTVKKVNLTFAYDITSGTYIYTKAFDYGAKIEDINSVIPDETLKDVKKDADDVYHYTFKEWKVREGSESLKSLKQNTLALAAFNATPHDFKVFEGEGHYKAPTCTEDGYEAGRECSRCGYKEGFAVIKAAGHTGGTATCTKKAVCEVCHQEYGDIAPDHHEDGLTYVEAKAATTQSEGNIEY